MQQINTPDGLFHDGNPATGELGTIVTAAWLNMLQAEVLSILADRGIAVDQSKSNQLLEAIKKIAWGGSGAARPTTLLGFGITDGFAKDASGNLTIDGFSSGAEIRLRGGFPNNGAGGAGISPYDHNQSGASKDGLAIYGHDGVSLWAGQIQALLISSLGAVSLPQGGPAQFDNSNRLVSSAWMRQFGMQASGVIYPAGTVALNNTAIGATVIPADGSLVTLPAANSVPAGARIEFVNTGSGSYSIARAGTNDIILVLKTLSSLTLYSGDTLTLESNGGSAWLAVGGSVLMPEARAGKQIAKAWVSFSGTTGAIRSSFNVSSVTRTAAGDYTVAFTNQLADANFAVVPGVGRGISNIDCLANLHHAYVRNAANVRIGTTVASQANTTFYQDMPEVSVVIYGN